MRTIVCCLALLAPIVLAGCRRLPVVHHRPAELPELADADFPVGGQGQLLEELGERTERMQLQLEQLEQDIVERNEELLATRQQYQQAIGAVEQVRSELRLWQAGVTRLERLLHSNDQRRLALFDELTEQVDLLTQHLAATAQR